MPLNTPWLYIVGFVVEADKYSWPVHNIFCGFILPDLIFPIVLMIHVSTLTCLSEPNHLNNPHTQLAITFTLTLMTDMSLQDFDVQKDTWL